MRYIALLLVLLVFLAGCQTQVAEEEQLPPQESLPVVTEITDVEPPAEEPVEEPVPASGQLKIFVLTGVNYKFFMEGMESPDIRVKEGDRVRIEFTSEEGFHDWVVDEFNAATEQVNEGGFTYVEFVADKKGTFEYYCSVGSHRANGMYGNLIVE